MPENSSLKKLKSDVKKEIKTINENATPVEAQTVTAVTMLIERVTDVGITAVIAMIESKEKREQYAVDKQSETEIKRMQYIEKMHKRDSNFKLIMGMFLIIVILVLVLLGKFDQTISVILVSILSFVFAGSVVKISLDNFSKRSRPENDD